MPGRGSRGHWASRGGDVRKTWGRPAVPLKPIQAKEGLFAVTRGGVEIGTVRACDGVTAYHLAVAQFGSDIGGVMEKPE